MKDIFEKFGKSLMLEMKAVIPKASGGTANSLELEVTDTGFIIRGSKAIYYLINGRKKTSSGAATGSPTLQEMIYSWIKAKSIQPREQGMTQLSLSWAISKSIHAKGYKGKGNFFKDVLADSKFKSLNDELLLSKGFEVQSEIIKEFKFN